MDGNKLMVVEWSMVSFTLVLVLLREYVRRQMLSVQDVFVALGWMFFVSQATTDTLLYRTNFFLDKGDYSGVSDNDVIKMLKISYVANGMYYTGLYCIKAAMLCFLSNLIDRTYMKKTWIALQVTVCVATIGFIFTTLVGFLWCQPVSLNWSLDPNEACFNGEGAPYIIPIVFHLLTDVMIYSLAFPVTAAVAKFSLRERLAVAGTFSIGFLCILFGIGTFVMYEQVPPTPLAALSAVFEQTWSVTVVCCPAFRVFFRRDVKRWTKRYTAYRDSRATHKSEVRSSWGTARDMKVHEGEAA